ncbi:MAG TPA: C4-type zinc ribbon domain-containing protein [Acidimicrobiia bacterium]|nr:C4-type zinc ribbon domain-containing protein [Acidimicrobiia bacterium]
MALFDDLLALQNHDSAADRLRHRRATLAERSELESRRAAYDELDRQRAEVTERRDAELREERRLDDEIKNLEAKAKAEDSRMYSGTVSSPRELQAMQADIDQLRRQAREREDEELEVMVRREALDGEVAELEAAQAALVAEMNTLMAAIGKQEAEIDAELAVEEEARAALVPSIPEATMRLYEQVRAGNRGIGAARLVGMNCQACHLALPATEVDRIRHLPPDELARCEHCGAILVR